MTGLACHNVTMETFAADLKSLSNGYVTNAVLDQTGLKGSWDFELKFTQRALLGLAAAARWGVRDLALRCDRQTAWPETGRARHPDARPRRRAGECETDRELAGRRSEAAASAADGIRGRGHQAGRSQRAPNGFVQLGVSPGGRVNLPGIPLRLVIMLAWNLPTNQNAQIIGAPKWLDSASFDIIGKLPSDLAPANGTTVPLQELGPALQALLIDRFKMKVHFEDRLVDAYTLIAVKPKLKKADPSTRTGCKAPANAGMSSSARPPGCRLARSTVRTSPWRSLRTSFR